MTTHNLKVFPEFYVDLENGSKLFEIRKKDRKYMVGDWLKLREYRKHDFSNGTPADYTGRRLMRQISYVFNSFSARAFAETDQFTDGSLDPSTPPLAEGYVILGLCPPMRELGLQLLGHKIYIGSVDNMVAKEATKYMLDLHAFVERVRKAEQDASLARVLRDANKQP